MQQDQTLQSICHQGELLQHLMKEIIPNGNYYSVENSDSMLTNPVKTWVGVINQSSLRLAAPKSATWKYPGIILLCQTKMLNVDTGILIYFNHFSIGIDTQNTNSGFLSSRI